MEQAHFGFNFHGGEDKEGVLTNDSELAKAFDYCLLTVLSTSNTISTSEMIISQLHMYTSHHSLLPFCFSSTYPF